jgi:Tfp pilus assembly protein PilN
MPKGNKTFLKLNLLHPQSEPQKLAVKGLHWALSAGRYIVIIVEILVLTAFVARFKFDADIQSAKESIEEQLPFIQSLKNDEILIRRTQFQLSSIANIKNTSGNYSEILKAISDQTPVDVVLDNIDLGKTAGKVNVKISGTAKTNNDLSTFILGLKQSNSFTDINLASVGLEKGLIDFSLTASIQAKGGKSL